MPDALVPIARWLTDFHCIAGVLLLCATCVLRVVKQPARRMVVSWVTMLGLLLVGVITFHPHTARVRLDLITLPASASLSSASLPDVRSAVPMAGQNPRLVAASPVAEANRPPSQAKPSSLSLAYVIVIAYLSTTACAALWLTCGYAATFRMLRDSRLAGIGLRRKLNAIHVVPDRIQIRVSDRIDQPMALGLMFPTIVLPTWIFQESNPQAIRAALAHELAHLTRGDLWLLAVCRWLLLPLFCNPLYWRIRKQIWLDQELLADHAVAQHFNPVSYAALLVAWSRYAGRPRLAGAVAMSIRASSLRERIVTLLDRDAPIEARPSRRWTGTVALVATISVLVVSSVSVSRGDFGAAAPSSRAAVASTRGPLVVSLAGGVELELVGIRQHPCEGETRWAADGRFLNEPTQPLISPTSSEMIVCLRNPNAVRVDWPAEMQDFRKLDPDESQAFATTGAGQGELYAVAMRSSAPSADVRLQLNIGNWRTLSGSARTQFVGQDEYAYCLSSPSDDRAVVHVAHPLDDQELRVVAIDFCDRQIAPSQLARRTGAVTATFAQIGEEDIREFYLQTRARQCVEFRNVSLRPGQRTNVEIVASHSPSEKLLMEL